MTTPTTESPESTGPGESPTDEPVERAEIGRPFVRPGRLGVLAALVVVLALLGGWSVLAVVGAVLVMIFFHELGHFLAARRAGMRVTEFFIGFGPRIWSFRRGDVEYGLKAIPAGAYVKIIGMSNLEEVEPSEEAGTYRQKPYRQRLLVAVAGSGMHFIMALILLYVAFVAIGVPDATHWAVKSPLPGSAAEHAGIRRGDRIVSVAGVTVDTMDQMGAEARRHPGETIEIGIVRDGLRRSIPATLNSRINVFGTVGEDLSLYSPGRNEVYVSAPSTTGVISRSGLREGDHVLAVNGTPVATLADVRAVVDKATSGTLEVRATHGSEAEPGTPITAKVELGSGVSSSAESGFLGVGELPLPQKAGLASGVTQSFSRFGTVASQSVTGLGHFFTPSSLASFASRVFHTAPGETHASQKPESALATAQAGDLRNSNRMTSIVGAIGIGEQVSSSMLGFLLFLAQLNIVIGIFNLTPLLPFDGGHVAVATYEKIRELFRRDGKRYFTDVNKLMPLTYAVVMLLVLVSSMALYLDIADPIKI